MLVQHLLGDIPSVTTAAPIVVVPPPATAAKAQMPHRIAVTCYNNHVNIFNIDA
jgi:hypothetical protein